MKRWISTLIVPTLLLVALPMVWSVGEEAGTADADLERARREVRLLDDVYKTAVVLVNEHYVDDASDFAAGQWAQEVFGAIRKKGWHDARLLDATGKPLNEENRAKDAFEERAIKAIREGKPYYDEVEKNDGKRFLRAATVVPVVVEKCTICHPGYKVGDVLGAIGYKLEVH